MTGHPGQHSGLFAGISILWYEHTFDYYFTVPAGSYERLTS